MLSIIIPTYNERGNLSELINRIHSILEKTGIEGEVILVDDNSPDGTGDLAEELKGSWKEVKVIHREKKLGLSSAVLEGIKEARFDLLCVMDSDLSHPPEVIPSLLKEVLDKRIDLAIASRYIEGGGIEGWSPMRKFISRIAIYLARGLTGIRDPVSGFFLFKRKIIEGVSLNPRGFKIGLEIIVKGNYKNIAEVPYIFKDRKVGKSKLSAKECIDYLRHLLGLYKFRNSFDS